MTPLPIIRIISVKKQVCITFSTLKKKKSQNYTCGMDIGLWLKLTVKEQQLVNERAEILCLRAAADSAAENRPHF